MTSSVDPGIALALGSPAPALDLDARRVRPAGGARTSTNRVETVRGAENEG
ncbi:hypothetical protein ACQPYK_18370 [Streptosporangium sp. CA-135522]|uniref:hypothetical protein n=1 Tax=Streptosporangium sp. CA-135522 TaxID=3240072 RepID=UPI003D89BDB1